jgi:nitroimidazol reductase NimA-like FMN-containing flavoprotein (pyridoxamine 5'-phosphate oxidase superfamily)
MRGDKRMTNLEKGRDAPTSEKNLSGYGAPNYAWDQVLARLEAGISQAPETGGPQRHTTWLATVRPDGRPHVMPLGVLWVDGALYFNAGPGTRKARNLARNSHCVITVATFDFDLVFEGQAQRVLDEDELRHIAGVYEEAGWETSEIRDGGLYGEYSAPSAGPPPWYVYRVKPETVFALGTSDHYGATRWRFQESE